MSYAILAFFALALWHFVYEAILAPSFRLDIRYDLFSLRDQLRELKIRFGDQFDDRHFYHLQDSLNALLNVLPRLDIGTFVEAQMDINTDAELAKRLERRLAILDDCGIKEARAIRERSVVLAHRAFIVNSGGWAVYVIPIAIAHSSYKTLVRRAKELISLSEHDLEKVAPDRSVLATIQR